MKSPSGGTHQHPCVEIENNAQQSLLEILVGRPFSVDLDGRPPSDGEDRNHHLKWVRSRHHRSHLDLAFRACVVHTKRYSISKCLLAATFLLWTKIELLKESARIMRELMAYAKVGKYIESLDLVICTLYERGGLYNWTGGSCHFRKSWELIIS